MIDIGKIWKITIGS